MKDRMWREIKRIIASHQNIVLTTHVNPDGDGIGAACAMTELLLKMGKKVRFVCDSPIPRKYSFLDFHKTHEPYQEDGDYSSAQVLIVLDTHRKERIGRVSRLVEDPNIITVCIDHHIPVEPLTKHFVVDPKSCSVGAMVYTFYKDSGRDLNLNAATGIYASIVCDTGRFCYSTTSRKAHKIAEDCIKIGVDPDLMYSRLFQHVTLAETKMFAHALQEMETFLDNKVAIEVIRKEDWSKLGAGCEDLEHIDLDYIHDFNNMIEDIQCFVLLRELDSNHIRVSLRSKVDLDISPVVQALGGGGHPHAAGLSWNGSLESIKEKLIELLKQVIFATAKS
jgi:phosphoesterase RecJ-like protein